MHRKIRITLIIAGFFIMSLAGGFLAQHISRPDDAQAQCVAVGPLNTGTLDGTAKGSPEQTALTSLGCMRLNNVDYVGGQWMSCPQGYYMAAITDDNAAAQDAFCCPFMI